MSPTASGFGNVVRALRIRNYRVYTVGNFISLSGSWVQRVAVGWLAWQLSHSGVWLGLCGAADLIPVVVVSPFAGAFADRVDRVRIIRVTQIVAMTQALVLAFLTQAGSITVEMLFGLTLLLGVANAANQPARLALIPHLVDRATLGSAVAINSLVFNSARFIGPAIAGAVIAHGSIAMTFAVNALSYVAFIVALTRITVPPARAAASAPGFRVFGEALAGYAYALKHPGIGGIMVLFSVSSLALRGFIQLLPGFADSVFGRGPEGFAWLVAVVGLGAVVGAAWMLRRGGTAGLTRLVIAHTLALSLAVMAFTATAVYGIGLVCAFVAGFSLVVSGIGAQTLVQIAVDPAMRGRVLGFYGMVFRAGPAFNAIIMGALSTQFGLRAPVAAGAAISLLAGGWAYARRRRMAHALEVEAHAAAD
ncbi:MAG: MFS transporter [Alphaproteobacteria bacterium]|nr:MFS transporter [Alphaproteobacteria bacterium]